jgi:hypothetical protein
LLTPCGLFKASPVYATRFTFYGLRFAVYASLFTFYGLRFAVYGFAGQSYIKQLNYLCKPRSVNRLLGVNSEASTAPWGVNREA